MHLTGTRVAMGLAGALTAAAILASCGSAEVSPLSTMDPGTDGTPLPANPLVMKPLDETAKANLRVGQVNSVDPQFPIADPAQFTVIVLGRVAHFRSSPATPDFPGARPDDASPWVVVKVEPVVVVKGAIEAHKPIYVELTLSDREGIQRAIPAGTLTLLAVRPLVHQVEAGVVDSGSGVPPGEILYIAGAPFAAFADGPDATWFPVLGETVRRPLQELVPAEQRERVTPWFR